MPQHGPVPTIETIDFLDFLFEGVDEERQDNVLYLLELSALVESSVPTPEWDGMSFLPEVARLTSFGDQLLPTAGSSEDSAPWHRVAAGFLILFGADGPLIDADYTVLRKRLSPAFRERQLLIPWTFDRMLSNEYVARFPDYEEHLSPSESLLLLSDSPQGVAQVGHVVAGPLGIAESDTARFIPPSPSPVVLSCVDPGCFGRHYVGLSGLASAPQRMAASSRHELEAPAPMRMKLSLARDLVWDPQYHDARSSAPLRDLPSLLSTVELGEVVALLIDDSPGFRDLVQPIADSRFRANGSSIARSLSRAELTQVALLAGDEELARAVEVGLDKGRITVPATEVRTPKVSKRVNHLLDLELQLSAHGLRAVGPQRALPFARLGDLLRSVYGEADDLSRLEWLLRNVNGSDLAERMDTLLLSSPPEAILREFIFAGADELRRALEHLGWGCLDMPTDAPSEERLTKRLLWKLGFDQWDFPPELPRFWERHGRVRDLTKDATGDVPEAERDRVRGEFANFFVSLEEILEQAAAYSTWVLLHDHYADARGERFVFELGKARTFAAAHLNAAWAGEGSDLAFSENGTTTLYPLIQAFPLLARLCRASLAAGETFERPAEAWPGWDEASILTFPYRHTRPILDLRLSAANEIIELLEGVGSTLRTTDVADLRNRVDHPREVFPSWEDLGKGEEAVGETARRLEDAGLVPSIYVPLGMEMDRFGRRATAYESYSGRRARVTATAEDTGLELPDARSPQHLCLAAQLTSVSSMLRFEHRVRSDYWELYAGFPPLFAIDEDHDVEEAREPV